MNAMADLIEAGKIRAAGVSNFSAERMKRAHAALAKRGLPLAVNQVRFSLIDRKIETNGILETAKELGVTIIAYTPLGSGLLTGRYHRNPELIGTKRGLGRGQIRKKLEATRPLVAALEEIGRNHEATAAQIALAWVVQARGEIVVTIPGATKVSQAAESAASMRIGLAEGEIARLDELSRGFR